MLMKLTVGLYILVELAINLPATCQLPIYPTRQAQVTNHINFFKHWPDYTDLFKCTVAIDLKMTS